jgi:hypothetical protein
VAVGSGVNAGTGALVGAAVAVGLDVAAGAIVAGAAGTTEVDGAVVHAVVSRVRIVPHSMRCAASCFIDAPALHFFHDKQKVHAVNPEESQRDVRDDGDDLAFQAVQELLQFALITRHLKVEAMDTIFGRHVRLLHVVSSDISTR